MVTITIFIILYSSGCNLKNSKEGKIIAVVKVCHQSLEMSVAVVNGDTPKNSLVKKALGGRGMWEQSTFFKHPSEGEGGYGLPNGESIEKWQISRKNGCSLSGYRLSTPRFFLFFQLILKTGWGLMGFVP